MKAFEQQVESLAEDWASNPRWRNTTRPYSPTEVVRLRGSAPPSADLARTGATKLWERLQAGPYLNSLGAMTGAQAVQMVDAGLDAVYVSGWQVAADANSAGQVYPDQSLYPVDSMPRMVRRIHSALRRADLIEWSETDGKVSRDWMVPVVADAEAGFGGALNAFELASELILAGAAGIHFEDQLSAEKKCGHMGGKVLVPTSQQVRTLIAARLAADVAGVPTVVIARTDARDATLITSDHDDRDRPHTTGDRTPDGTFVYRGSLAAAIDRGIAFAPHADLVWCETSTPDLDEAREYAQALKAVHPEVMLGYNCSPSFKWDLHQTTAQTLTFQADLAAMGYRFQFVTLAGWHAVNLSMFELAQDYKQRGMAGYVDLQRRELDAQSKGYTAVRHQRTVGAGYYDLVTTAIAGSESGTLSMLGSTEADQFEEDRGTAHGSAMSSTPTRR